MTKPQIGRPPKDPDGEPMKVRTYRATDAQQSDFKLVGWDAIRTWVTETAAKIRSQKNEKSN